MRGPLGPTVLIRAPALGPMDTGGVERGVDGPRSKAKMASLKPLSSWKILEAKQLKLKADNKEGKKQKQMSSI